MRLKIVKCVLVVAACVGLYCCMFDRWHTIYHARQVAAMSQIENFIGALAAYHTDVGSFPTTDEWLEALRTNPGHAGWNGPYLPKDVPRDPWGTPYAYIYPGTHGSAPDIVSYGADRQPGGEGINSDIVSWRPAQHYP